MYKIAVTAVIGALCASPAMATKKPDPCVEQNKAEAARDAAQTELLKPGSIFAKARKVQKAQKTLDDWKKICEAKTLTADVSALATTFNNAKTAWLAEIERAKVAGAAPPNYIKNIYDDYAKALDALEVKKAAAEKILGVKFDSAGQPISNQKASNILNLKFKKGTSDSAQAAISAVVESQMKLWKAVNKQCDTLGLDCQYYVNTCVHPSSPPVVTDVVSNSWPFELNWTAPGGRKNLRYSVLRYDPAGSAPTLTESFSGLDDTYKQSITRPALYGPDATSADWATGTSSGKVLEYHVIADAKCHSEANGAPKDPRIGEYSDSDATKLNARAFLAKYSSGKAILCSQANTAAPYQGWTPVLATDAFTVNRTAAGSSFTSTATLKWNNPSAALTGSDATSVKHTVHASTFRRQASLSSGKVVYVATSAGELAGSRPIEATNSSAAGATLSQTLIPADDLLALADTLPASSTEDHLKRMVIYQIKATTPCGDDSPFNSAFQVVYKCAGNGRWYDLRNEIGDGAGVSPTVAPGATFATSLSGLTAGEVDKMIQHAKTLEASKTDAANTKIGCLAP